jgi:hypothetical protein
LADEKGRGIKYIFKSFVDYVRIFSIFIVRQFGVPGVITCILEVLDLLRLLSCEIAEGLNIALGAILLA